MLEPKNEMTESLNSTAHARENKKTKRGKAEQSKKGIYEEQDKRS